MSKEKQVEEFLAGRSIPSIPEEERKIFDRVKSSILPGKGENAEFYVDDEDPGFEESLMQAIAHADPIFDQQQNEELPENAQEQEEELRKKAQSFLMDEGTYDFNDEL